jgi:tetratricopeptide (TPR) repeat protein
VEVRRRVLGPEHPDTLQSMNNLAVLYNKQGKHTQAEALFTQVLEPVRRVLGKDHPDTLTTLNGLGFAQLRQHKYVEAETAFREVVKAYEKTAPEAWSRYYSQSRLGASLAGQKRYAEAEPLLLSGFEGLVQRRATIPAESQSSVQDGGEQIVQLYQDWGKQEKAAEWRQKLANSPSVSTKKP